MMTIFAKLKGIAVLLFLMLLLAACGGISAEESRQLWIKFDRAQQAYRENGESVVAIIVPSKDCQVWLNGNPEDVHNPENGIVKLTLPVPPEGKQYSFRTVCSGSMNEAVMSLQAGWYWGIKYTWYRDMLWLSEKLDQSDTAHIFEKRDWFEWTLEILEDK